jgi:hypothetical protein
MPTERSWDNFFRQHTPPEGLFASVRVKVIFEKKTGHWLPALAWAMLIGWLSTQVRVDIPDPWIDLAGKDKLAHFLSYALLAWLAMRSLSVRLRKEPRRARVGVFFLCSLYGLFWEVVQWGCFPLRHFEWADQLANMLGVFAGLSFFIYIYPANPSGGQ